MTKTTTPTTNNDDFRALDDRRISQLESQGCHADDWQQVRFNARCNLNDISGVYFRPGVTVDEGAVLHNIPGGISNCRVGKGARVVNVASVTFTPESPCGVGTPVAVLDESGSRPVVIYPGLSAQTATLMARVPKWLEDNLKPDLQDFLDARTPPHEIGDGAEVRDCGPLLNVSIGPKVTVRGARALTDGAIVNNSPFRPFAFVGDGVDARNFIIEDARVEAGAILRNVYAGQGVILENGFTAHDSLFFANCQFANGESCALLAGPYTVSMHKASLLIGCQTAFMNTGSGTNQSNHMYKLGPVHWGVFERGVKTSSGAYVMLAAKIGPFSMVMGQHKTHPDSSAFPFSYLFGDQRGATVVVPGAMLRSCGLMRDEKKWPARDRRLKRKMPLNDRIVFNVLNPYTVDAMLNALDTIRKLLAEPTYDDLYMRYKGMKFSRAALERSNYLYNCAIFKYLDTVLTDGHFPDNDGREPGSWVDVGGQIMLRSYLDQALQTDNIPDAERIFTEAFDNYERDQMAWIGRRFGPDWRKSAEYISFRASQFDTIVNTDRDEYLNDLARQNDMLAL